MKQVTAHFTPSPSVIRIFFSFFFAFPTKRSLAYPFTFFLAGNASPLPEFLAKEWPAFRRDHQSTALPKKNLFQRVQTYVHVYIVANYYYSKFCPGLRLISWDPDEHLRTGMAVSAGQTFHVSAETEVKPETVRRMLPAHWTRVSPDRGYLLDTNETRYRRGVTELRLHRKWRNCS